jgi:hypothetical protein
MQNLSALSRFVFLINALIFTAKGAIPAFAELIVLILFTVITITQIRQIIKNQISIALSNKKSTRLIEINP